MRILVVEAAALHLGFAGCYGNEWVATPNLDRLAAEGVVFDQHFADAPDPAAPGPPWQRALGAGRYACAPAGPPLLEPARFRYASIGGLRDFAARAIDAVEGWRDGDTAVLWLGGPSLAPPWALPDGLLAAYADDEDEERAPLPSDPPIGLAHLDVEALDGLQSAYAAVVTFFDAQLGRVLDHLRERRLLDSLLVCVTARYGFPLGEHDMTGVVRPWLHDELVHLPLVVRFPSAKHGGGRVAALTQPVDLVPTLAEWLGVSAAPAHGRSLLPLVRGEADEIRPYAVSGLRLGEREERLLRTPERALLLPVAAPEGDPPRRAQLYLKPDDRWEVNDLAARSPEEVERLERALDAFVEAARAAGSLAYPPIPEELAATAEEGS